MRILEKLEKTVSVQEKRARLRATPPGSGDRKSYSLSLDCRDFDIFV